MSLTWPWMLALLLVAPALLGLVAWMRRRRRRAVIRVTSLALVRAAVPQRSSWTRRVPVALLLLGLLVLAVGAARPQLSVPVPRNATTILLAFDVSRSMCSTDVDPNRLAAAQDAAVDFVESQRSGARIGLVGFAGTAGVLVPPTDDLDKVVDAIKGFTVSRGTAIGQAILTSLDALAEIDPSIAPTGVDLGSDTAPASYAPHAIVLLTDGANTQGVEPVPAARQAAGRGVRVFTIGFGTTGPSANVCTRDQVGDGFDDLAGPGGFGFGGFGGGFDGRARSFSDLDEPTLTRVAELTGGQYVRAASAGQLRDALTDLPSTVTLVREKRDTAAWFAGLGGLLVAAAVGLSLWWSRPRGSPARSGVGRPRD